MKPFTVTSPTNALSVVVYGMLTFYGFALVVSAAEAVTLPEVIADAWAMLLFLASITSVYAVLSAPRRRDPDVSLAIEFGSSVVLAVLLGYLAWTIGVYATPTGRTPFISFGMTMIFCLGFGARAIQIFFERRGIKRFRDGPPPTDDTVG